MNKVIFTILLLSAGYINSQSINIAASAQYGISFGEIENPHGIEISLDYMFEQLPLGVKVAFNSLLADVDESQLNLIDKSVLINSFELLLRYYLVKGEQDIYLQGGANYSMPEFAGGGMYDKNGRYLEMPENGIGSKFGIGTIFLKTELLSVFVELNYTPFEFKYDSVINKFARNSETTKNSITTTSLLFSLGAKLELGN